jgi:hypothetical protein
VSIECLTYLTSDFWFIRDLRIECVKTPDV